MRTKRIKGLVKERKLRVEQFHAFGSIKKILIPIDGSDYSVRAAEFGLSVAKLLNAEVTGSVYVVEQLGFGPYREGQSEKRAEAERELKGDGERYLKYVHSLLLRKKE